ncbi:MAG: hypothetical protein COV44_06330 [Deltaproteobacteria bacterium CG11_big_fil_rev_8_21_14_0_20_45_16]|nr:MAG: hypothetical protein COV44_06330 [Deltaproteobacteria bacterium CG11_big_fil_rev_8_21_14_0_20_45_16]
MCLSALLGLASFCSLAQEDKVIVLEKEIHEKPEKSGVFVESGSDIIVGEPQENVKAAYRTWQTACDNWKRELKAQNSRNLMIASCGSPKQRVEKVQLTSLIIFESQSTYKIKVGCE